MADLRSVACQLGSCADCPDWADGQPLFDDSCRCDCHDTGGTDGV